MRQRGPRSVAGKGGTTHPFALSIGRGFNEVPAQWQGKADDGETCRRVADASTRSPLSGRERLPEVKRIRSAPVVLQRGPRSVAGKGPAPRRPTQRSRPSTRSPLSGRERQKGAVCSRSPLSPSTRSPLSGRERPSSGPLAEHSVTGSFNEVPAQWQGKGV